MDIQFARIDLLGKELNYVQSVLESGWLTTAGKTLMFEEKFARAVEAQFACAVNSCTAALHLGLEALGVEAGDRVLVPTMTFTSSAEVVRYLGADPVFVDVAYETRIVTPKAVKKALEEDDRIKAVIVVHFGGQAAPLLDKNGEDGILSICKRHGVKLVEDAAHAFPAYCVQQDLSHLDEKPLRPNGSSGYVKEQMLDREKYLNSRIKWLPVGSIGDVTCFSFYANKTITTGEGGMLATNDANVAERVRMMRLHGINRDVWNRYTGSTADWEYDVAAPGFKYNMPDINAAIGLAQLERAEEMRKARQRVAEFYIERLSNLEYIDIPRINGPFEYHAWHLFCIVLKPESPVSRNEFIEKMAKAGIGTSVHYKPLHRMTYYQKRYKLKPESFPNAERIWQGTVSLPIYPGLTEEEMEYVVKTIHSILY